MAAMTVLNRYIVLGGASTAINSSGGYKLEIINLSVVKSGNTVQSLLANPLWGFIIINGGSNSHANDNNGILAFSGKTATVTMFATTVTWTGVAMIIGT